MSLRSKLYTLLSTNTDISNIVGNRITPSIITQNQPAPYILYSVIAETPMNTLTSNNRNDRRLWVQIDCVAETFSETETLSVLVANAILSEETVFTSTYKNEQEDYDSEVEPKTYRRILEFHIFGNDN